MALIIIVIGVAAALTAYLILRRRSDGMPAGWTAITCGKDYGAIVDPDGSFYFPQTPKSIHYVTKACSGLAGHSQIRLRYRIEGGPFIPASDPKATSIGPTLYFQRDGDDWSGIGEYDGYRWYATFTSPAPIVPGEFEIIAPLDGKWTGVEHFNSIDNTAAFVDALKHVARVGFVFGGGTGYGHGVYGAGRFTLLEFAVE